MRDTPPVANPAINRDASEAAFAVISILECGGWSDRDILDYFKDPQPGRDRAYEQSQIADFGAVRITAAEMRGEIRRLLSH